MRGSTSAGSKRVRSAIVLIERRSVGRCRGPNQRCGAPAAGAARGRPGPQAAVQRVVQNGRAGSGGSGGRPGRFGSAGTSGGRGRAGGAAGAVAGVPAGAAPPGAVPAPAAGGAAGVPVTGDAAGVPVADGAAVPPAGAAAAVPWVVAALPSTVNRCVSIRSSPGPPIDGPLTRNTLNAAPRGLPTTVCSRSGLPT